MSRPRNQLYRSDRVFSHETLEPRRMLSAATQGVVAATQPSQGLTVTYYDNLDFTGRSVSRIDPTINFNWGNGSPDPSIQPDTFAARWTGRITPRFSDLYTFHTITDDGVRLWIDGKLIIDQWKDHPNAAGHSGTITLQAGQSYDLRFEYYDNTGTARANLLWSSGQQVREIVPVTVLAPSAIGQPTSKSDDPPNMHVAQTLPVGTGLLGEYYATRGMLDSPLLTRVDERIDFNWGTDSPAPEVAADGFAVRWSGQILISQTGKYVFRAIADDGVRLWVDGKLLINDWTSHSAREFSGSIDLQGNRTYSIRLEYFEQTGTASVQLAWTTPDGTRAVIPTANLIAPQQDSTLLPTEGRGLTAEFFEGQNFQHKKATRTTDSVTHDWGTSSPHAAVTSDSFSVRWTGEVKIPTTGLWTFHVNAVGGVRLWVNDQLLVNRWDAATSGEHAGSITLNGNTRYAIRMEYRGTAGASKLQLSWSGPGWAKETVPTTALYQAKRSDPVFFNTMSFTNQPSLSQHGFEDMIIGYEESTISLLTKDKSRAIPENVRRLAAIADERGVPLLIDIESWPIDLRYAPKDTVLANLKRIVQVLDWAREGHPNLQLGFYNLPYPRGNLSDPQTIYLLRQAADMWRGIDPDTGGYDKSHDLLGRLDFFAPSFYVAHQNPDDWVKIAEVAMSEARRLSNLYDTPKPVYPFVWMEYQVGVDSVTKDVVLRPDYWRLVLETVTAGSDGAIMWGGWKRTWNEQAVWWQTTKSFLQDLEAQRGDEIEAKLLTP